ncbi:MAG: RnfABCDGE type electron transport complex subunit G [Oscillospiraceae bacterium]
MNMDKKESSFIAAVKKAFGKFAHLIKANWHETLRPVAVLSAICLITSLLLGVTNQITAPIIKENSAKAADAARTELLPDAKGFEKTDFTADGVTEVYKSLNDVGYVITAEAKGYGGMVPVMISFGTDDKILNIKFLDNSETPGLGKKIMEPKFAKQFTGKGDKKLTLGSIDAIAGATISSSATVNAINSAIELYKKDIKGEEEIVLTKEQIREVILPNAGAITPIDVTAEGIVEAYKGEKYGLILYAVGEGFYKKPLNVAVGFDDNGVMTGAWIDGTNETEGVGTQIGSADFAAQFAGKSDLNGVEAVAGASVSSKAAMATVQKAIDAYGAVKGGLGA